MCGGNRVRPLRRAMSARLSVSLVGLLVVSTGAMPPRTAAQSQQATVAIIVGPVGEVLTPTYIELAEQAESP